MHTAEKVTGKKKKTGEKENVAGEKKKTPGKSKKTGEESAFEKGEKGIATGKKKASGKGKTTRSDAREHPRKSRKGKPGISSVPAADEEVVVYDDYDDGYAVRGSATPPPPGPACRYCGEALTFIPQYGRDYCYGCGQYD